MADESEISEEDIFASAKPETTTTEGEGDGQEGQTGSEDPAVSEGVQQAPKMVPVQEAQSERRRRKAAEKSAAEATRELAEMRGRMTAFEQLIGRQNQPQTAKEPVAAPDIFLNTEGAIKHHLDAEFAERIKPLSETQRSFQTTLDYNNRLLASQVFTDKVVKEAEAEFLTALNSKQLPQMEYDRVVNSPNRYAEAVRWQKERRVQATVGDDPDKWFDTQLETRLQNPEFQQQLVDKFLAKAEANGGRGKVNPVFNIPSLNKAPGSPGTQASGPISEADIFASAPARMGGRS